MDQQRGAQPRDPLDGQGGGWVGIQEAPALRVCRHKTALPGRPRAKTVTQSQAGQKLGPEKEKSVETKTAVAEERGRGHDCRAGNLMLPDWRRAARLSHHTDSPRKILGQSVG